MDIASPVSSDGSSQGRHLPRSSGAVQSGLYTSRRGRAAVPIVEDMRLTDGGLETSLIFHQGLDLPLFAAFPLVETSEGKAAMEGYWMPYLEIADQHGVEFVVDTVTWRANPDWGTQLGYDAAALAAVNEAAARFARHLSGHVGRATVNGVVGPRGDGYVVGVEMTADEAAAYHSLQVAALAGGGVDQVSAITLTYPAEAIGFVRAAQEVGVPCVVSFTVETDGRLPNGGALRDAVEEVDRETGGAALGFMVNCAHPTHLGTAFPDGDWLATHHRAARQRLHPQPRRARRGRGPRRR